MNSGLKDIKSVNASVLVHTMMLGVIAKWLFAKSRAR
jgi:hypothetical protein